MAISYRTGKDKRGDHVARNSIVNEVVSRADAIEIESRLFKKSSTKPRNILELSEEQGALYWEVIFPNPNISSTLTQQSPSGRDELETRLGSSIDMEIDFSPEPIEDGPVSPRAIFPSEEPGEVHEQYLDNELAIYPK